MSAHLSAQGPGWEAVCICVCVSTRASGSMHLSVQRCGRKTACVLVLVHRCGWKMVCLSICSQTRREDDAVAAMETNCVWGKGGWACTWVPAIASLSHCIGCGWVQALLSVCLSVPDLTGSLPHHPASPSHLLAGVIAGGWALVGPKEMQVPVFP